MDAVVCSENACGFIDKKRKKRGNTMSKKEGIIAYFDILGYQNFLINNEIEYCIAIIEKIILKLPEKIKNEYIGYYTGKNVKMNDIKKYFDDHCDVLFVSDTIIFFFDFDSVEECSIPLFLYYILFYLSFFKKESFEEGFPLRGYVDYGEYYNNNKNINIFAGKTIVDCYKETNNLNFSGLIISDNLHDHHYSKYKNEIIDEAFKERYNFIFDKNIIAKYLVNTKEGEKDKYIVNFLLDFDRIDITQYIFESFHKHNKKISNDVMEKIRNTEKLFRYFKYNNDLMYPC
jgi:hypothetical protein